MYVSIQPATGSNKIFNFITTILTANLSLRNKNQENPFLVLMGFTHTFSIHASTNPSILAFAAAQTENSLRLQHQKRKT